MADTVICSTEDRPHLESLQAKLDARAPHAVVPITPEEMTAIRNSARVQPEPAPDREDIEAIFRYFMQVARYLAKKYGFKIKQWPEN